MIPFYFFSSFSRKPELFEFIDHQLLNNLEKTLNKNNSRIPTAERCLLIAKYFGNSQGKMDKEIELIHVRGKILAFS